MLPAQDQLRNPPDLLRDNTDSPPKGTTYARLACTECSRRKQKCNKEWPCNHCKKRKVADKCRFNHDSPPAMGKAAQNGLSQDPKRKREHSDDVDGDDETVNEPVDYGGDSFEALGYSAAHLFAGLSTRDERKIKQAKPKPYFKDAESCPQLSRALRVLPPRPHTDLLIQNFLLKVNYHYYIMYQDDFLKEYQNWWRDRGAHRPLGLQWTCLLATICACSIQYTEPDLKLMLESDLGLSLQRLSETYHNAARELYSVIPVGHSHIYNVQQLLHSCYWYKSEARFVESWHVLSAAIREAQELRVHQESRAGPITEFEREMRRRLWTILNTWDWQISTLLGKPMIIDRSDCDVGLPSLSLEEYDPSPLLHMKLQSAIINQLAQTFGLVKYITAPADVQRYTRMLEAWMDSFPRWYSFENPDRSADEERPCVTLHRHYLQTMAHSMMLDPIRPFLARHMSSQTSYDELQIRSEGIDYCFNLIQALRAFFDYAYPKDAKFHYVIFAIFDTTTVMCSALIHDLDGSLPRQNELAGAIKEATDMLGRLSSTTAGAKPLYEILLRIGARAKKAQEATSLNQDQPETATTESLMPPISTQALTQNPSTISPSAPATAFVLGQQRNPMYLDSIISGQPPSFGGLPHTQPYLDPGQPLVGSTNHQYPEPYLNMGANRPYPAAPENTAQAYDLGHSTASPWMTQGMNEQPIAGNTTQGQGLGAITEQDLGNLASVWQYRALNLDFINPQY